MAIPHEQPRPPKKKKKPTKKPPQAEAPARRGDINPSRPGQQAQGQRQAPSRPSPTRRPEPEPRKAGKKAKKPIQGKPPPRRRRRHDTPGPGGPSLVGPAGVEPAAGRVPRAPRDNQDSRGPGPGVGHTTPRKAPYTPTAPGPRPANVNTISIQRAMKADDRTVKVDGRHGPKSQRALEIRARAVGQRQRNRDVERIEAERIEGRPPPGSIFSASERIFGESTGEVTQVAPRKQDPVLRPPEGRPHHGDVAQRAIDNTRIMRARVRQGQRRSQSEATIRAYAYAAHVWLAKTRFNSEENASRARPADVRAFFFEPEFGRWGHLRVKPAFVANDIRGANLMRAYLREQGHRKTVKAHGRWDDSMQDAVKAEAREWKRVERHAAVARIKKLFYDSGIIRPPSARDQQLIYLPFAHGYIDIDEITPRQLHDILHDKSPLSKILFKELMGRLGDQRDAWAMAMQAGYLSSGQRVDSVAIGRMIRAERAAKIKAEEEKPWWQFSLDAFNWTTSAFTELTEEAERGYHVAGSYLRDHLNIGLISAGRVHPGGHARTGDTDIVAPKGFWDYYDDADRWFDEFDKKHPWWGLAIDFVADPLNLIPPLWFVKPFSWTGRSVKIVAKFGEKASLAGRGVVHDARFLPDRLDAVTRLPAVPYHAGVWSAEKAEMFWNVAAPWLKQAPGTRQAYKFAQASGRLKDDVLEGARKAGQLKLIEHVIKVSKWGAMDTQRAKHAKALRITIGELAAHERKVDEILFGLMPSGQYPGLQGLNDDMIQWLRENRHVLYAAEGSDVYSKVGAVVVGRMSARISGRELSDMLHDQAWQTTYDLIARNEEMRAVAEEWGEWAFKERVTKSGKKLPPRFPQGVEIQGSFNFAQEEMVAGVKKLKAKYGETIPPKALEAFHKSMRRQYPKLAGRRIQAYIDEIEGAGGTVSKEQWQAFFDRYRVETEHRGLDYVNAEALKINTPEAKAFAEREFVRLLLRSPVYKAGAQDPRIAAMLDARVRPMLEDMHNLFLPRLQKMVTDGVPREELWHVTGKDPFGLGPDDPSKVGKAISNNEYDVRSMAEDLLQIFNRGKLEVPNVNFNRKFSYKAASDLILGEKRQITSRLEFQRRVDEGTDIERDPNRWNDLNSVAMEEVNGYWLDTTNLSRAEGIAACKAKGITYKGKGWYDTREVIKTEPEYALHLMDHMDIIRKYADDPVIIEEFGQDYFETLNDAFKNFEKSERARWIVRNADGTPQEFQHGSPIRFAGFSDEALGTGYGGTVGTGHYFSPAKEIPGAIKWRADQQAKLIKKAKEEGTFVSPLGWVPPKGTVYRVNLMMKNPLNATLKLTEQWLDDFEQAAYHAGVIDFQGGTWNPFEQKLKEWRDYVKAGGVVETTDYGKPGLQGHDFNLGPAERRIEIHDFLRDIRGREGDYGQVKRDMTRVLQELGHDAVQSWDEGGFGGVRNLAETVVFSADQIVEPQPFTALKGALPSADRAAEAFREIYNIPRPLVRKPWGPDMESFYGAMGTNVGEFRKALQTHRQELEVMRRAEVVRSLKEQGAYWQALRHAQGKPYRVLYWGLAGAMGLWRFLSLPLNPGWLVRNVADNWTKLMLQGTIDPRAWWYEGVDGIVRHIFDVDVARMRDAMRFIDRVHGRMPRHLDPQYHKARTYERRYMDHHAEADGIDDTLWNEGLSHGYTEEELLSMLPRRVDGVPEETLENMYGLGGPANPTLRSQNAASDWFEHTLEAGFWSAPIKQIESVFKHYDIELHPKVLEHASMAHEGDRLLPRFHDVNKGKVVPGRAPSKTTWGTEERIVDKWKSHWGGVDPRRLVKGQPMRRVAPSGQVYNSKTGELMAMSPWEQMRMGVDPTTGQWIGAWVARFHDNVWELFGSRPENVFKRVLYRDAYKKAMRRHGDAYEATQEAWAAVEKTLFDYSKITVVEDNFRIFFPFIQFWRKNFGFWLRTFAEKPWFLQDLAMYQETLEEVHKDQPPWMRRYVSLKEVADIVARVPALEWMAEHLSNARIDPLNLLSFAPLYRAFKSTNPNLPPEEAGIGFLAGFIDALNEWGMSMNPLFRKPLEWVGVLDFRSWQNIIPQTSLIEGFTQKHLHEFFPDGLNIENWFIDPILSALGKETMTERAEKKFNDYVQLEMAGQAKRGEAVSRERAEKKIRGFLWAKTLVGFFAGTYIRRMTPQDVYFSKLSYGMSQGQINYFNLSNEEKLVYQLYKKRNFDTVKYDEYVEALPLLRSYYNKSYEDGQQMLLAHPELIPYVTTRFGRRALTRENIAQEIMLKQKSNRTMELFDLIEKTDLPWDLRRMASQLLVTPEIQEYWDRKRTLRGEDKRWKERDLQWKMIRGQYQRRIDEMYKNYYAISDGDWEAKQGYMAQHPELERYMQAHGSASDDYRTIAFGVEKTLRDRYFEILDTKNAEGKPSFDEAIDFLQQFPFIFDSTAKRKKYREVARVGYFPGYTPGGYARGGGGTWRDYGMSEHARDYLHARPFLDKFFKMIDNQGKQAAYEWLDSSRKGAQIVRAYFNEYSKGGKVGSTPKARAYLKAKKGLDHFFALPKGQRDRWLWGRSPMAKLVREYFRKYASGGLRRFEDRPMSQHHKDYLEAKSALALYFGMSEAERIKWLDGNSPEAQMVRDYFDKYADERGQTQHAKDYLAIKPVLEQYFALPKGAERRAFIDAHPELADYFAKYSDTDKTEKAFTVDGRGGQYAPAHWSYGHSQRYQGRGASRGPGSYANLARFFDSKDPQLRRRLEFWRIYFSLPPDQRPQFVLEHADEYGVFVYGVLGPQDEADKQSEMLSKAFAFARDGDRSMLYGLLQPLIDFYFSLEDPAEQQLMLRANPELQAYFDLTAGEISTGDPELDKLLEQYFMLPKGSRMRTILLDQNPALRAWVEENSTQNDDALHALLEVYFALSASEKKQYRIDHPELQEYFDKRSEEKDNEKMQLEAFDRADPRLKKYFDVAKDEIEYAAWLRKQQMLHESLREMTLTSRRERRQEEELPVMAY